jgi:Sulfotransferase domain
MKPNFMLIGAAKCATTTIRTLLGAHPDVFVVSYESQFFNEDTVFVRGIEWYESLYAGSESKHRCGEGCNSYTMKERYPRAFERLSAYAPDLKLIYVVREPFERIESFWLELRSQHPDYVHHNFDKSVRLNRDWLTDASNYLAQLDPYRKFYGDESIHVVFYEDFRRDPASVMRGCFEFLGIDADINVGAGSVRLNESQGKAIASPILSQLRSIPLYRRAMWRIPFSFRDRLARKFLYRKVTGRPQWKPETRSWVADLLRDDLRTFLVRYGKPADFWSFDAGPESAHPPKPLEVRRQTAKNGEPGSRGAVLAKGSDTHAAPGRSEQGGSARQNG